jgi:hypothetical protein
MGTPSRKKIVFISYTDENIDKVKVLEQYVNSRQDLSALIIANNREALKPLAEKVSQGIIECDIIVPILTKESISAQWINQEIGFASALQKKILPLIEKDLLSKLKGFIHKQIDLPYLFESVVDGNFGKIAELLVKDIPVQVDHSIEKDQLKKNLSKAQLIRLKNEFEAKRREFIKSKNSPQLVIDELFDVLFTYLETQLELIRKETSLPFPNEISKGNPIGYLVKTKGFSFTIVWDQPYYDSIKDSKLKVRYWQGGYLSFDNSVYFPSEKASLANEMIFHADLNEEYGFTWTLKNQNQSKSSKEIVDMCFEWLLKVTSDSLNH